MTRGKVNIPPSDALDDAALQQPLEDVVNHKDRRHRDTRHITAIGTGAIVVMLVMVLSA